MDVIDAEDPDAGKVREFVIPDAEPDPVHIYDVNRDKGAAIVIDNGAYDCRAGWAHTSHPSLVFRNRVARTKAMRGEPAALLVGNEIKDSEASRYIIRPYREKGLVTSYTTQEEVLDYIFEHLGVSGSRVDHRVVMTEPVCNPNYCRGRMNELLFELYGVDGAAYGIDALYSFGYGSHANKLDESYGLVVSAGHSATHIMPVVDGRFDPLHCKRLDLGGEELMSFMDALLKFSHMHLAEQFTANQIQTIVHKSTFVAADYVASLRRWSNVDYRTAHTHVWQLPFVRPDPISEEEKRRRRQEQGDRLREFMRKKREKEVIALQEQLERLEAVKQHQTGQKIGAEARKLGYKNLDDLEMAIDEITDKIRIKTNQMLGIKEVDAEPPPKKELVFDLLDKDDKDLTPDQRREKKKQRFLKNASEGRERARQERLRLQREKEEQERMEEERRRANPEHWLRELKDRKAFLTKQRAMRQRRKAELQDRRSAASKQRMRLIMQQANDDDTGKKSGKGGRGSRKGVKEDTFGIDDDHWQVYRQIGKEDNDSEDERDEEELVVIEQQLAEHDPDYVGGSEPVDIEEHHRARVGVERLRVPELLFQPSMVGEMSSGIAETMAWVLKYYTPEQQLKLAKNVHVTGGVALTPGFTERIRAEVTAMRPFGTDVCVLRAKDPSLDAWRGAQQWASSVAHKHGGFGRVFISRSEYEEMGSDYLKEHERSNRYYPRP